MNHINDILHQVLKKIIPTPEELYDINEIIEVVKVLLKNSAKELNIDFTIIEPQGSTGIKQTQLRNDFDIDIFIGLNYDLYKQKYEGLSKTKLKKETKKDFLRLCNDWIIKSLILKEFKEPRLLYAEHPYVTVDFIDEEKKLKVKLDLVLYFELSLDYISKNGIITAVDRSPWHGRFVRDNLSKDQKDDVRLLKQFFKSCHSYGDKSAVGKIGFIGYSAELLIYHYGTIEKLFNSFNSLTNAPLDYFKRSKTELEKIQHFQNDFLILTDPVDSNRNVASAISERAYKYCNQRIKDFLENPSPIFFEIKPIPEAEVSSLDNYFIIEIKNIDNGIHYTINRDKIYVLGEKIKANGEKEYSHEERFGTILFEVYFKHDIGEYNLAIYCIKPKISKTYLRKGPSIKDKEHADRFKQKNPTCFKKDGFLWIETKRKYTTFLEFLNAFIIDKLPDNLEIINVAKASNARSSLGKKTLYVLKNMVLPFINE
ncbi:MAG: hypothetical protein ACFFBP_06145 [Promethearchaeota archaeon]